MILLIGGTSETAPLAAGLAGAGYAVLVSTATEIPLDIGERPLIRRRAGRLDAEGMAALARQEGARAIIDAAHPYAVAAHAAASAAAAQLGIPCLVFRRPEAFPPDHNQRLPAAGAFSPSADPTDPVAPDRSGSPDSPLMSSGPAAPDLTPPARFAADHGEAARIACAAGRPVLLTTGSRNLVPYAAEARRAGVPLAVRVLDDPEALAACREAGIPADRIIAGRGPFGLAENLTAIRRFGIGVIVTKESGLAGGLEAKLAAAQAAGCLIVIVRRPELPAAGPIFDNPAALVAALRERLPPNGTPTLSSSDRSTYNR